MDQPFESVYIMPILPRGREVRRLLVTVAGIAFILLAGPVMAICVGLITGHFSLPKDATKTDYEILGILWLSVFYVAAVAGGLAIFVAIRLCKVMIGYDRLSTIRHLEPTEPSD
jgi:MFS family permease